MATSGAGNPAQSDAGSTPSTSTSGAGAPKAMTWAEKLASKASASSNSTANSIPTMSIPSSTPSRPAQSTNSAPSRTATRPHAAGKGADGTSAAPAQKQRTHTSADSGWGEGDSSHDGQASAEGSTSQSAVPAPSIAAKAAEETISEVSEPVGSAEAESAPPAVKQPSGPPKVNIWKVRQEENAKRAAEQAKLLLEQEAIRAAQAPEEASAKQATGVSDASGEATGASAGKKTKGQKKRENATLAASNGPTAVHSPTGGATPKTSQNAANGKTPVPASNAQQLPQSSVAAASATAIPNPDDTQAWPSPLEDKAKEDAELARKSMAEREERERQREESTSRSVSSVAGSPTAEKKKPAWKTLQPEITFNAPIPNRQGQPAPRTGSRSPTVNKSTNGSTSGASNKKQQNGSGKSKNSSTAASPVEEKSAPTMQKTASNQSSRRPSKAVEKAVANQKPDVQRAPSAPTAELTAGKSTLRPEAEAHQPFTPRPSQPVRNPSSSATPADAGLPAKPIGSRNTPNLSSMQHPRPPSTPKDSQPSISSHASTSGPSPAVTPSLSTASTNTETGPSTAPSTQSEPVAGPSTATDAPEQVANPQRSYQNQSQPSFSGPKKPRGGSSATRGARGGISGTGRGGYSGSASNRSNGQAANASQHANFTNGQHQSNFHNNNNAYQGQFFFDPATGQPIPYYAPPTYPPYPAFPGQQQFYSQHQTYSNTSSPPSQQQMLPFPANGTAFNPYAPPPMPYQPYPQENAQFQQQMYERPAPLYDYSFYPFPNDCGTAFFVLGQIEFYFSKDNLVRDGWMRQNMDAEGWIEIAVIAAFKRLASLTSDVNLVKQMMRLSCMVEIRENKVRTVDWQHWVLPTAKPTSWQDPKSSVEPGYQPPQQVMGMQYMQQPYDQQTQMQYYASPQQAPYQPYQASAGQSVPSVQSNKEENPTMEPAKGITDSSDTAARASQKTAETSTA